ncbi:MAG: chromate transporter [Bacteroidales bacterium]|nr:chromate transporter [Candidatus Cacconaster merdequi]
MKLLLQLFWSFFKIGSFTFGSGYAMIPMIEKEVVDKKKWFEKEDFYNQFALASSAPGPFAINTAVFVGYRVKGWWGSLAAVLGAVIPSFTIILLIAMFLTDFRGNPTVEAAFKGIRPAVIALIAVPFIRMLQPLKWYFILLAVAVATVIWQLGVSPIYFILAGGAIGAVAALFRK